MLNFAMKYRIMRDSNSSLVVVEHVRRRSDRPPSRKQCNDIPGEYGETRNSCLLSLKYGLKVATSYYGHLEP